MFDVASRYSLALDVLHGREDAHKILADMLDEEDDRALAEWARARKRKRQKRLDFVLAVMPYRTDLRLACEFLAHALMYHQNTDWVIEGTKQICAWVTGNGTVDDLTHGCLVVGRVVPWAFGIQDIDRVMQSLHTAAKCAEIASLCEQEGDARTFRGHAAECRNGVRRVARGAREMAKRQRPWEQSWRSGWVNQSPDELNWQIRQVDQVIGEMLEHLEK